MKEHIYFVNAHPDDLIACMGLCMRLSTEKRFEVHVVDVTRGERGLSSKGVSMAECAAIRTKEEEAVCGAMGLKPQWLNEIDGEACASKEACQALADMFIAKPPRAIFTQWPVDRHLDHMVCSTIALNALRFSAGVTAGQMKTVATEVYFTPMPATPSASSPTIFPWTEKPWTKVRPDLKYECQNVLEWLGRIALSHCVMAESSCAVRRKHTNHSSLISASSAF